MWMMLQQHTPGDYIIATGENHSVREFIDVAFQLAGLDYREYVEINPLFFRPAEVDVLLGDYTKARHELGWNPETGFRELVREMVVADCGHLANFEVGAALRAGSAV
jgi:GDPmannose 4,6-dehydratase